MKFPRNIGNIIKILNSIDLPFFFQFKFIFISYSSLSVHMMTLNNDECYLTVELGCCLARITHLMFTLKFFIYFFFFYILRQYTYLNGLYLRMKSSYMQCRTLRMKRMTEDNTIGDVKLLQKSENANDEVHCNLPEDINNGMNGRDFEVGSHKILNTSKSERDFEQYEMRKQRFHIGSKWKRDENIFFKLQKSYWQIIETICQINILLIVFNDNQ
uniref:Uncharacterized protein n=1 Tax=Wuchereria bancrofti TaxID=6293 RepID=A0A1I8ET21_WUCBA